MRKSVQLFAVASLALSLMSSKAVAADFSFSFSWGDIKRCTSGNPNTVFNPKFVIKNLPAGTSQVQFRLKDLNAPSYNHGGGRVSITNSGTVPSNVFKYKSPCPPGGQHTYEWTAIARDANGKKLATARAQRKYPE